MKTTKIAAGAVLMVAAGSALSGQSPASGRRWKAHDLERPKPVKVNAGHLPGAPPSDAVVLFDGRNLDAWSAKDGSAPKWVIKDGVMEAVPGAGPVATRQGFGDGQLHIEWATPLEGSGQGQGRGNSGVYLMSKYEVQILESRDNVTYADGQAAAIYGQHPPLVNVSRGPGEWQSYDIIFRRPRFSPDGTLEAPAQMTVFHNGVLVHDAARVWGPTNWLHYGAYSKHPDALPLLLQDHAHPVRFRNIWIRPLPDLPTDEEGLATSRPVTRVPAALLARYAGSYGGTAGRPDLVIERHGAELILKVFDSAFTLVPETTTRFVLAETAGVVDFSGGTDGRPLRARLFVAEVVVEGDKTP
jgi:hypothetical protein